MLYQRMLRALAPKKAAACVLVLFYCARATALSIVFISPGFPDEQYWMSAHEAMQNAAESLDIKFEHHFTSRDQTRVIEIAQEIARRPLTQRPDFVIGTNDRRSLVQMARILDAAGIKTFGAYSGLQGEERREVGPPRNTIPNLIGTLEPNVVQVGYLTAKALITQGLRENRQSPDGRVHLLALAGDKSTPSSVYRNQGAEQAVQEFKDRAVIDQMVFTAWNRKQSRVKAEWLLARYPQAQLVWSATDQIAFGAMDALQAQTRQPGRTMLFSAINTSTPAMQALMSGQLATLAGGHFMAGAWSMVVLYDYAHGRDFAVDEGLELVYPMFTLFDKAAAERYVNRFGQGIHGINFRRYSKVLNPAVKRYSFPLIGQL